MRPDSPEFGKSVSVFLIHMGRQEDALEVLLAVAIDHPHFVDAHHLIGRVAFALGRHGQALEAMRTAVALDPKNFDLRISLAQAERDVGRKSTALDHINQILATDPEYPAAKILQARWI